MQLNDFFRQNPRIADAFSGGVDSSYLLHAAKAAKCDVRAYFIKSEFQPQFELDDAVRIASHIDASLIIDRFSILSEPSVTCNASDRCYFCKTAIIKRIRELARSDGFSVLCDGSNADDDEADRPGMRALYELGVVSPLRESGLGKSEIRLLSDQAGLFTHDKPAYACLATRIPTGTKITAEMLETIERAETALFDMGFSDFRVRLIPPFTAKIQVSDGQWDEAVARRSEIIESLSSGFSDVVLDLKGR